MSKKKETEKKVYKLYAMRTTTEAMDALRDASDTPETLRFTRITAKYMLIYASDEKIMRKAFPFIKYTIIGDEEVSRLSSEDREWLTNCNFTIIAEEALKNKDLVLQSMADALQVLEEELEKNSKKVDAPKEEKDE